jgi:hypothetical protein
LRTYKYILKLHSVENGEYSIIHLLSPTCTSLDNVKNKQKYIWMHIKYVINHCDKIKDCSHVDH